MQPEQLAEQIAELHGEPVPLTDLRRQAATDIDPGLADRIEAAHSHSGGDRVDVSERIWERLQDRMNTSTTIQPLIEAVQDDPDLLTDLPAPASPIQRLCQAFFTNGVYIRIEEPDETILQPVLHEFANPKIDLIIVQATAEAEATVIEGCSAPRSAPFRAGYTIIDADEESDIRYGNLQNWNDTPVLDSTRARGDSPVDHFLDTGQTAIIEADTPSRVLTPETAFRTDSFCITDMAETDGHTIEHAATTLTNIPQDYRTEIDHILGLGE